MNANAKNLQIKTVSVSLQVITIDDKQMTLSVFRQIPERCAFNIPDGSLNSLMNFWGKVRYQIEKNGPEVWAVGALDGHLFRCPIEYPIWTDITTYKWALYFQSKNEALDARDRAEPGVDFLRSLKQLYIAV